MARAADSGRLDVLVTSAGIIRDNLVHKMTDDDWEAVIATHLRGSFLAAQAAKTMTKQDGGGAMVLISSTSALGNRGQANYSAAKAGIQGLTKTLAIELGRFGVRVELRRARVHRNRDDLSRRPTASASRSRTSRPRSPSRFRSSASASPRTWRA